MKQGLFEDSPKKHFSSKTKVKPDWVSTRKTSQTKQERRGTKNVDGHREMSGFDMSVDVLGGALVYDYQSNHRLPKPLHGSIYLNYCWVEIRGLWARRFPRRANGRLQVAKVGFLNDISFVPVFFSSDLIFDTTEKEFFSNLFLLMVPVFPRLSILAIVQFSNSTN